MHRKPQVVRGTVQVGGRACETVDGLTPKERALLQRLQATEKFGPLDLILLVGAGCVVFAQLCGSGNIGVVERRGGKVKAVPEPQYSRHLAELGYQYARAPQRVIGQQGLDFRVTLQRRHALHLVFVLLRERDQR